MTRKTMHVTRYAQPMSPRMPYHSVLRENGASLIIRSPFVPRKANASQTSAANPTSRTHKPAILHALARDSGAEGCSEMEQKAAAAERYIATHHQSPDHPSTAVSGVS